MYIFRKLPIKCTPFTTPTDTPVCDNFWKFAFLDPKKTGLFKIALLWKTNLSSLEYMLLSPTHFSETWFHYLGHIFTWPNWTHILTHFDCFVLFQFIVGLRFYFDPKCDPSLDSAPWLHVFWGPKTKSYSVWFWVTWNFSHKKIFCILIIVCLKKIWNPLQPVIQLPLTSITLLHTFRLRGVRPTLTHK